MEVVQNTGNGALISYVTEDSPAYDAGFEPGCRILAVDGMPLRDLIDWRWLTADDEITLTYIDLDGEQGDVDLWRDEGEDWGFEFEGVVFDGIKLCRNACTFCFMRQLPEGMRDSLSLRDDDFRLSFLSGTFVTLTNIKPEDEERIISQHLSPLRVSLHVTNPEVRTAMIGKHAMHGLEVLDRLLAAGIEVHAQIVLMPEVNDGEILKETLAWAYERPGILNVGIVPLGYTKHQAKLDKSFNDPVLAQRVIETILPFQKEALEQRETPWVFAADEFYTNAFPNTLLENLPPSNWYGSFDMFEDGIGIVRSFVDDWENAEAESVDATCAEVLQARNAVAILVQGCATKEFLVPLIERSSLKDKLVPLFVKNEFFGGNVDVTGLLVGEDIASAITAYQSQCPENAHMIYCVPEVILNDQGLMLDGMTVDQLQETTGVTVHVVSCNARNYLTEIIDIAQSQID